jgi:hypothetical protein
MSVILISTYDGSDIAELVVSSRAGWPWKGALWLRNSFGRATRAGCS